MFGRRILGGAPDSFRMSLGHELAGSEPVQSPTLKPTSKSKGSSVVFHQQEEDDVEDWEEDSKETYIQTSDVEWTSDDPDPVAISRLKKAGNIDGLLKEVVEVRIWVVETSQILSAAAFEKEVQVKLSVVHVPPQLRRLELARVSPAGSPQLTLLTTLMRECRLEGVEYFSCTEGLVPLWDDAIITRLSSLKSLQLSACGLPALPPAVSALSSLRELNLAGNKLTALPKEIGCLGELQRLYADNNAITALPVELKHCKSLRKITLENNKLATPVMDLRAMSDLKSLQLFGNPLEFLPELSPCKELRHLSLANVRLHCDEAWSTWEVEVTPLSQSYMGRGQPHRLASLFALIFRRSSCQHPLLAGSLGKIAEDPLNCAIIATEVGAIQQLILMALSDNEVVTEQACKTIGLIGKHNSITTNEIIDRNVLSTMVALINSKKHKNQLAGLNVISGLALSSEAAAKKLLTPDLLTGLLELVRSGPDEVKTATLETMGNLAFVRPNRITFLQSPGLVSWLASLANGKVGGVSLRSVQLTATRTLAIFGENETVRQAVGRHPIVGRGVRILSMDGGGMKGIAIVRQLRQLEERTGRRIHELFDLICGTSTGGILAVAVALKQFSLNECEQIYRNLGQRVFIRPGGHAKDDDGWRDSLYRAYKSGQQSMRVAVYGCKHDAAMFELLLKEYCIFDTPGLSGNSMIDTACLGTPKCFVVSTWASMTPAEPYLFRNYEYPLSSTKMAKQMCNAPGSSSHEVWQAVRASSAAPYYLDDFKCGTDRFQDGAATANNPSAIAMQQARLLWPDTNIECLVSIGSGTVPVHKREKSMSSYMDTGNVLIESACSVDRVDTAIATLAPLIPDFKYFRFCPSDMRCGIELDEIDPAKWKLLEDATDEFIIREDATFDACASLLVHNMVEASPRATDIHSLSIGSRRGVIVIEAPRAGGHVSNQAFSQIEDVARRTAANSHTLCHKVLGSTPPELLRTDVQGYGKEIAAVIEEHKGNAGVVHLGLYAHEDGLVTSWQHKLEAIAEPSAEAELLSEEIGHAGASLSEVSRAQTGCEGVDNSWIQFLSQHTVVGSQQPITSHLFQRTQPKNILLADDIRHMLTYWEGKIVVAVVPLPVGLAKALLESGAKAVICRQTNAQLDKGNISLSSSLVSLKNYFSAEATDRNEERTALLGFFQAFYRTLLAGFPIVKALAAAGEAECSLDGAYVCCVLNTKGELITAESRPQAKPSSEADEVGSPKEQPAGSASVPHTPKPQLDVHRRRSG